jgi:hypothetical protein
MPFHFKVIVPLGAEVVPLSTFNMVSSFYMFLGAKVVPLSESLRELFALPE